MVEKTCQKVDVSKLKVSVGPDGNILDHESIKVPFWFGDLVKGRGKEVTLIIERTDGVIGVEVSERNNHS